MAFWVCYDHLGKLLLVNLICVALLLVPGYFALVSFNLDSPGMAIVFGGGFSVLTAGVLAPVFAAGIAQMSIELIETRDGSIRAFFSGMRRHSGRAVRLGLLYSAAFVCLATSTWFYAARFPERFAWLGYGLSAIALWCLFFLGLTLPLAGPALVHKSSGALAAVRLSALLVLDNPLFALGLAFYTVCWATLSLAPPVLMLFSLAPMVVLFCSAYEMLSRKYMAAPQSASGDTPQRAIPDEEDDYLNRGFRDFLFPWKD